MKRFVALIAAVLALSLLAGCGAKPAADAPKVAAAPAAKPITLKVGVTAGPHEQIIKDVAARLAKENITLDIKVFTDYKIPNQALQNKELDVNIFQHQPYLDKENKERGFTLVTVAKAVTFPMGVYSKKVKKLNELKEGARVAIPNDATNGGRALLLFQAAGLIKLKPEAGITAGAKDIVENPKKLKFEELDAAMLPRVLPDVDAAAINTNYALDAGLSPIKDAIYLEQNSPYVNVIAVRPEDKERPEIQKLIKAYQSPETKQFIDTTFQGAVVVGW
ncbi:MAG TPA: MetQ/NlpA family ABC transporter substrate-binding protein [Symbiobacteriaceae bacterium]|jgi:D-methionine transport system substrate-binding protein